MTLEEVSGKFPYLKNGSVVENWRSQSKPITTAIYEEVGGIKLKQLNKIKEKESIKLKKAALKYRSVGQLSLGMTTETVPKAIQKCRKFFSSYFMGLSKLFEKSRI